jgi:hypothetical protein
MNGPGWRRTSGAAKAGRGGGRIDSVERQTELRQAHPNACIVRMVMVALAGKARLRLNSARIVRIDDEGVWPWGRSIA